MPDPVAPTSVPVVAQGVTPVVPAADPSIGQGTPTPAPGPTPTPADSTEPPVVPAVTPAVIPATPAATVDPTQKRMGELTAEKWEERRAREAAERRAALAESSLAEMKRMAEGSQVDPVTLKPIPAAAAAPTGEQLREMARQEAVEMQFNEKCNAAVIGGRAAHPDFDASLDSLRKISGPIIPRPLVEAALETGQAAEVLYHLGRDLNEADRIMSLPPIQQAVALTKFATEKLAKAPIISAAPAPIGAAVGSGGGRLTSGVVDLADDSVPMDDWMKTRKEQVEKARRRA